MEKQEKDHTDPSRWRLGVDIEIAGEARFLSHHDLMRLAVLAALRARLPLRFSQGFNPRPKIMLPSPRPVGAASRGELLVLEMDGLVCPDEALRRLARQTPPGITPVSARILPGTKAPQPEAIRYCLELAEAERAPVADKLDQILQCDHWPWDRPAGKGATSSTRIDLRPLVRHLSAHGTSLEFELGEHEGKWAKPVEVLGLLGLERDVCGRLVRESIRWKAPPHLRDGTV